MVSPPARGFGRTPRFGTLKLEARPDAGDHDGRLLLRETVRMVGKAQYPGLFEALRYTYGGSDAGTTFGLPPLGGRIPIATSTARKVGDTGGAETVKLGVDHLPAHAHSEIKAAVTATPNQPALLTSVLGIGLGQITKPPTTTVSPGETGSAGGGQAHDNMPPYLALAAYVYAGMAKA